MPFDKTKITTRDNGEIVNPASWDDWKSWVSASRSRSFVIEDPILDWLDLYGESKGFTKDTGLKGYVPELDFGNFIMSKGNEFESAYMSWLSERAEVKEIGDYKVARSLEAAERAIEAMNAGAEIITQAPLRNPENMTYGQPDLLVRLDVLFRLFPGTEIFEREHGELDKSPPKNEQYRVIDIKYSSIELLANGTVSGKNEYKSQVDIYNRALGRVQGFVPRAAYLAGRAWKDKDGRTDSAVDAVHPVLVFGDASRGVSLGSLTDAAVKWRREVQLSGSDWDTLPTPTRPELYPNASNTSDGPWHVAKSRIAAELGELTRVSYVSPSIRRDAHAAGISSIDDPGCTAASLGITGPTTGPFVDRILSANRCANEEPVLPANIHASEESWRHPAGPEFFVDFETVSNLDDDFSRFPTAGGQPLVFIIGCGHVEDEEWKFTQFTVDRLDVPSERKIIDDWIEHMGSVANGSSARVYHWSQAEPVNMETAYRNARDRHPQQSWPSIDWFDLYRDVFYAEPVGVKGALGLGLKAVANAMRAEGLIQTGWGSSQVDGLGAMVAAWFIDKQADQDARNLSEYPLMQEVGEYNEVDCRVMQEILFYLRENH